MSDTQGEGLIGQRINRAIEYSRKAPEQVVADNRATLENKMRRNPIVVLKEQVEKFAEKRSKKPPEPGVFTVVEREIHKHLHKRAKEGEDGVDTVKGIIDGLDPVKRIVDAEHVGKPSAHNQKIQIEVRASSGIHLTDAKAAYGVVLSDAPIRSTDGANFRFNFARGPRQGTNNVSIDSITLASILEGAGNLKASFGEHGVIIPIPDASVPTNKVLYLAHCSYEDYQQLLVKAQLAKNAVINNHQLRHPRVEHKQQNLQYQPDMSLIGNMAGIMDATQSRFSPITGEPLTPQNRQAVLMRDAVTNMSTALGITRGHRESQLTRQPVPEQLFTDPARWTPVEWQIHMQFLKGEVEAFKKQAAAGGYGVNFNEKGKPFGDMDVSQLRAIQAKQQRLRNKRP